jgi:hypothetical protein
MVALAADSLLAYLAQLPEPRSRRGRRFPLAVLLAATCVAIAQWARTSRPNFSTPSASTAGCASGFRQRSVRNTLSESGLPFTPNKVSQRAAAIRGRRVRAAPRSHDGFWRWPCALTEQPEQLAI